MLTLNLNEGRIRSVFHSLALVACAAYKKSGLPSQNYVLGRVDSIRIAVNAHTNVQAYAQLLKTKDREMLCSYQFGNDANHFHLYDLAKGVFNRTIPLRSDGPDGVAPVVALTGTDSLWVYEINSNRFYLVTASGTVIRKIDLGSQVKGFIQSSPAFPNKVTDNVLHFFQLAEENPNSREFLKRSKPERTICKQASIAMHTLNTPCTPKVMK